jgi:hypothetical protein
LRARCAPACVLRLIRDLVQLGVLAVQRVVRLVSTIVRLISDVGRLTCSLVVLAVGHRTPPLPEAQLAVLRVPRVRGRPGRRMTARQARKTVGEIAVGMVVCISCSRAVFG